MIMNRLHIISRMEYMVNDAYIDFTRDWMYYDAGSTEYLR